MSSRSPGPRSPLRRQPAEWRDGCPGRMSMPRRLRRQARSGRYRLSSEERQSCRSMVRSGPFGTRGAAALGHRHSRFAGEPDRSTNRETCRHGPPLGRLADGCTCAGRRGDADRRLHRWSRPNCRKVHAAHGQIAAKFSIYNFACLINWTVVVHNVIHKLRRGNDLPHYGEFCYAYNHVRYGFLLRCSIFCVRDLAVTCWPRWRDRDIA